MRRMLSLFTVTFVCGILAGVFLTTRLVDGPLMSMTVNRPTPTSTMLIVPKPVITTQVVKQVVADPKQLEQVRSLLAENAQLHSQVTALTIASARAESHGEGPVAVVPSPDPGAEQPVYHFKDWRLDFTHDGKTASYDLHQQFEILQTTGRQKNGQPLSIVKLFEVDDKNERRPIPATSTTLFADQTLPHWSLGMRVQAGIVSARGLTSKVTMSGAVGIQWLVRGRTKAAEDSTYTLLTPVVTFGGKTEVGILPLSINLGQLPRQPFKDIWVSPYVGGDWKTQRVTRLGFALTSTF